MHSSVRLLSSVNAEADDTANVELGDEHGRWEPLSRTSNATRAAPARCTAAPRVNELGTIELNAESGRFTSAANAGFNTVADALRALGARVELVTKAFP